MEKVTFGDTEIEFVSVRVAPSINTNDLNPILEIAEGEYDGVQFQVSDMHIDDQDNCLLHYNLSTVDPEMVDKIKPLVDNWIIGTLCKTLNQKTLA